MYYSISEKKFEKNVDCIKKGCNFATRNKDASVAQLVEHLTLNQGVQGSTPCGSTIREANLLITMDWLFSFCIEKLMRLLFNKL